MTSNPLIDYLERRAGEQHRGTIRYDGDGMDVLYLRDDIQEERLKSELDRMLGRLRPESSPKEEQVFPFGGLRTTVRIFERAIILHFPVGNDRGVVVSLEPETARDLSSFVGECEKRINA